MTCIHMTCIYIYRHIDMFGMSQKLLWELKNFQLPGDSYLNRTSILAPAAPVARLVSRGGARRESQCCQEFPRMENSMS